MFRFTATAGKAETDLLSEAVSGALRRRAERVLEVLGTGSEHDLDALGFDSEARDRGCEVAAHGSRLRSQRRRRG